MLRDVTIEKWSGRSIVGRGISQDIGWPLAMENNRETGSPWSLWKVLRPDDTSILVPVEILTSKIVRYKCAVLNNNFMVICYGSNRK